MKRILSIVRTVPVLYQGFGRILFEEARWPFNLAFTLVLILFFLSTTGCAPLSKAERASCTATNDNAGCISTLIEHKEYERQKREDERLDHWRATVKWCNQHTGMSMWYSSRGIVSVKSRRTGIPDRSTKYGCADTAETMKTIKRGMRGGF